MHRKSCIKGIGLTLMLIVCFYPDSLAQERDKRPSFFGRGHCIDIFTDIKDKIKSDSVAIQELLQYYSFENGVSFTTSEWRKAIRYIETKENTQLFCRLKDSIYERDFVVDSAKETKLKNRTDTLRK